MQRVQSEGGSPHLVSAMDLFLVAVDLPRGLRLVPERTHLVEDWMEDLSMNTSLGT